VLDREGAKVFHDGNTTGETSLREYWTLGKRDGRWTLLSIEQDEEGEHQLGSVLEADPLEDTRLTDQARVQAAVEDALPEGVRASEVDDDDARDATARARDLAVADARFDPDIIESTVRRGVAAWAQAVDGDDAAFAHLAQPRLLQELLYPPGDGGRTLRLVVRAPVVRAVTLLALDSDAEPPTATVRMELEGVRYVEDRDTLDLVAGSKDRASRFDGVWTLALDGPDDAPWRISAVRDDRPGEAPSAR
jgi:predicted lipid-binding transport protein (Tim44 family)